MGCGSFVCRLGGLRLVDGLVSWLVGRPSAAP